VSVCHPERGAFCRAKDPGVPRDPSAFCADGQIARLARIPINVHSGGGTSSLFGLAPCVVCPARCITAAAVRSYRTFSPLPRVVKRKAVCSLWHFPSNGLEPALPDVIRHTALWSSDFPLPAFLPFPAKTRKATVRPSCQQNQYIWPSLRICLASLARFRRELLGKPTADPC
jgi:hypothetical protein